MKEIMTRAWAIYRTLEGDRLAKMAMALRQAWAERKQLKMDAFRRAHEAFSPRVHGQITRFEAGVIYKAMKQGVITISLEAINRLYHECDRLYRFARERYNQDHNYYDGVQIVVGALLIGEVEVAQEQINNRVEG